MLINVLIILEKQHYGEKAKLNFPCFNFGIRVGYVFAFGSNLLTIIDQMRVKSQVKQGPRLKIAVETQASITDFQYNHNGTQLAVADSEGFVYIYARSAQRFQKTAQFRGDEGAIWSLAWAQPQYGEVIGIGTFRHHVGVFQNKTGSWVEVASHQLHQGSVNHIEFASTAFGFKLFSAGSDGTVGLLQLKKGVWNSSIFKAHESSIHALALRPLSLSESEQEIPNAYPLLATVGKDNLLRIWRHIGQKQSSYVQVASSSPHKESIRALLWKRQWSEFCSNFQIFSASEDGTVKLSIFQSDELAKQIQICSLQAPIFRISQSLTGDLLSVSVENAEGKTFLYSQGEVGWAQVGTSE